MPRSTASHLTPRPVGQRIGCIVLPAIGLLLCGVYAKAIVWDPTRMVIAARQWTPVPCQITSSAVVRRPRTGSRSVYKLDIRYRYTFGNRTFTSNRYDAIDDYGSGGYESMQRAVRRYPAGSAATCYVNPEAPHQSLIDRGLPARMWWGVIAVVGILGCLARLLFALALEFFDRTAEKPDPG